MKKILYFAKTDPRGPSSRYRIYQYLEGLEAAGIRVDVSPLFGRFYFRLVEWPAPARIPGKILYTAWRFARRMAALPGARKYDAVMVEHQLFPYLPPIAERRLKRRGARLGLEFDDAIYLTRFHDGKMRALTGLVDRVLVGNRFLAAFAGEGNRDVTVVPTTVDETRYALKEDNAIEGRSPAVGWVGLRYNFDFFRPRGPSPARGGASFRILSSAPPSLPGVPLDFIPWSEADEARKIGTFDVGIMPLPPTPWAEGKCALKILQYMAAGVPVVASPVGVNRDIVRDGENGFLATTEAEWRDRLTRLLDPGEGEALRRRIGRAGRRTVEEGIHPRPGSRDAHRILSKSVNSFARGPANVEKRGSGSRTSRAGGERRPDRNRLTAGILGT